MDSPRALTLLALLTPALALAIPGRCVPGSPEPDEAYAAVCPDAAQFQLTLAPSFTDVGQRALTGFQVGASVGWLYNEATPPHVLSKGFRLGTSVDVARGVFEQYFEGDLGAVAGFMRGGVGPAIREGRFWNADSLHSAAAGLHFSFEIAVPLNGHDNWNWTRFWRIGLGIDGFLGWEFRGGRYLTDIAPLLLVNYDFANFGG